MKIFSSQTTLCLALLLLLHTLSPILSLTSTVKVQIRQAFPYATPKEAQEAWLSYHWKQGGGLPLLLLSGKQRTRLLLPIGMQEELVQHKDDSISYRVTDMGPLLKKELSEHSAHVSFVKSSLGGTEMIWNVQFDVEHFPIVWETVTNVMISTVSANLAAYLDRPLLYQRTTRLPRSILGNGDEDGDSSPVRRWIDFCWKQGGGLLAPVLLDDKRRLIVPPFLLERLLERSSSSSPIIDYTVDNPSLWTLYPVHSHMGRVEFESSLAAPNDNEGLLMKWQVQVRPMRGCRWWVQSMTDAIISVYARNFKSHMIDPNATVPIAPPRGAGKPFLRIPKDTWLGGVLDAHLHDKRSTLEQTLSLFKPWTWGRQDEVGEGATWRPGWLDAGHEVTEESPNESEAKSRLESISHKE